MCYASGCREVGGTDIWWVETMGVEGGHRHMVGGDNGCRGGAQTYGGWRQRV